jgi:hypothetical protein
MTVVNTPPVANNGSDTTSEDTSKSVTLTGSDANGCGSGQTFTFAIVTPPANGDVTPLSGPASCSGSGTLSASVTYTPDADFNGTDTFTFKFNDGFADSNTATFTMIVSPVNDPPVAVPGTDTTNEDTAKEVTLRGADVDGCGSGQTFTFAIVMQPANGSVSPTTGTATCSGAGVLSATVTYEPDPDFNGPDSFTFKFNDGSADSNTATFTITVLSVPDLPGKVTGGGQIKVPMGVRGKDFANFGFNVQRKTTDGPVTGQLEYQNHARGLNVHSVMMLTLDIVDNTATFTGTCIKAGTIPCTFTVVVEDNDEPGRNVDEFTISVSGEPIEGSLSPGGQPITKGNIQIHHGQTSSGGSVAAAGAGVFPSGAVLNGVTLNTLQLGSGVVFDPATGDFQANLVGTSLLGGSQTITVEGRVDTGFLRADGSVIFEGLATVDMGNGTVLSFVPFSVSATAGEVQLTILGTVLPVATLTEGGITIQ